MPGLYVNDAGTWKEITSVAPQVKDAGVWKPVQEVWVKDAGTWKKVWPNIVSPTPTNLRFGTRAWANNRYEVQVVWDPITDTSLYDKYQLEVTRVGGTNPVTAQIVDIAVGTNFWNDIYPGTTGGIQLQYRVRSSKAGVPSAWSGAINTTTPNDAGFCKCNGIQLVGDSYGHLYMAFQHDGNPENIYYDLYRKQANYYDWIYINRQTAIGTSNIANVTDTLSSDHYRGSYAGSSATQNAWPETVTWTVHLVNSWGKPNNQANTPYPPYWSAFANGASWKLTPPGDRVLRLNAVGINTYRRQPTNSVGWVGAPVRCGGASGDFEGLWLWDSGFLADYGFWNRIRAGQTIQFGIGRSATDGGSLNVPFTIGFVSMSWGSSSPPAPLTLAYVNRTWQRGQGEQLNMPANIAEAFCNPSDPMGSICVYSGNSSTLYAEFGDVGQIVGGWVNGQLTISSPLG